MASLATCIIAFRSLLPNTRNVTKFNPTRQQKLGLKSNKYATHRFIRMYHSQMAIQSWRTIMRPDLVGTEPWVNNMEKGSPEFNELLNKQMNWWREANTDQLGQHIMDFLDNGGTVRYGIVQKFISKSNRPEHLKVILRCLTYLQARWNKDMTPDVSVPLSQAIYRAQAPDFGLRILNAPWMRIWPSLASIKPLFLLCTELAEMELFKYPSITSRHYRVPDITLPNNFKPIQKNVSIVKDYASSLEEEPEKEQVVLPKDPSNLQQSFDNIAKYASDPRFGIVFDERIYLFQAEYWAAVGNLEKVQECIKCMKQISENENTKKLHLSKLAQHLADHLIPTAYLAAGHPEKTLEFESSGLKTRKLLRSLLAAHLCTGDKEGAYNVLKAAFDVNQLELTHAHMGKLERLETIRLLYNQLKEEGVLVKEHTFQYLDQTEEMLKERQ